MTVSISRCKGGQDHKGKKICITIMLHKTNMVPKYLRNLHALNLKYAQTQSLIAILKKK